MKLTRQMYAVLRTDGTIKEHRDEKSLAIFSSESLALNVPGKVVLCTITYEA